MKECKAWLSERVSLVVKSGGKVSHFSERGVKTLYGLCAEGQLKDSVVADRVVGRAAALLMVYGGVREAYAAILSARAVDVLQRGGVSFDYGTIVDHIVNRTGEDECPMEKLCKNVADPKEAYRLIGDKLRELQSSSE